MLLLGARSDIGGEIAERVCQGREVVLAARGNGGLQDVEKRLLAAGAAAVRTLDFDAKAERFADAEANKLLTRAYREGFAVPEKA